MFDSFVTPWTVACQALSVGFPRQQYWRRLPFLPPGIFLTQGSNPHPLHCRYILHCWATEEALQRLVVLSIFLTMLVTHTSTKGLCMQMTSMLCYAKSLQSCPTLCDPVDGSPPGSPIPGILQARTLEWVAISFSNAWKWKVKVKSLSPVWPLATPWIAA